MAANPRESPAQPLLLALETATDTTSVALLRGSELRGERSVPGDLATAEGLLPAVDALLVEAGERLAAVDVFAVSIGPGSFTGLRIGVATLKGLVFGTECAVVAVPTLAALACAAPAGEGPVVALLDARRGEVYAGAYAGVRAEDWLPEAVYVAADLAARLPERCRLVGEGVAVCAEAVREARGAGVLLVPPPEGVARARHVGALAFELYQRGEGSDPSELVPRYLRRAQAEVKRTGERYEPAPGGASGSETAL